VTPQPSPPHDIPGVLTIESGVALFVALRYHCASLVQLPEDKLANVEILATKTHTSVMSHQTTKPLPVCEYCRDRKIKCEFYQDPCRECRILGLECVRTSAIRFKHHLGGGSSEGQAFPSRQVWTLPKTALRYHDETPELIDMYDGNESSYRPSVLPGGELRSNTSAKRVQTASDQHNVATNMSPNLSSEALMNNFRSPQNSTALGAESQNYESPWAQSVDSQFVRNAEPVIALSATEALLLRNYTENMALWADGTDPGRSFELEASRRAITNPILLYAIVNRHRLDQDPVALEYQSMCLQLLIPAISGPDPVDDSARAAVAILRQNEEMDGKLLPKFPARIS
jgi:hypothetical protein